MKTATDTLRSYGLCDEEILNIALKSRLCDSVSLLKCYLFGVKKLDTVTATNLIQKLKQEL